MDLLWVRALIRAGLAALAVTVQGPTLGAADPLAEVTALYERAVTLYEQGRYAEAKEGRRVYVTQPYFVGPSSPLVLPEHDGAVRRPARRLGPGI
jgi:hypothetical protein